MNNTNFEKEILNLIECQMEGDYWDFKQTWYSNNADLLHDIICMANSPANRDCYIIIGITDETFDIIGVSSENRKNQQNVIELLRQKPKWAGGYIPEVYVKTMMAENREIDVIIIKQSNNTPFYLLEDYKGGGKPIFKGAIYTRKGDTNTPKTSTADLYDTELLWKRRFGLLYNPSQRAKFYLKDLDNWERVENDKSDKEYNFLFYRPDPDYTIHLICESESVEDIRYAKNINDVIVGIQSYYLFAFCNVSYHTDYSSGSKVVLYYKRIPLFSSVVESVDEGRTNVVPPELSVVAPHFIQDSFQYLMFEFVFKYWGFGYSDEAREMFLRVIPVYKNQQEYEEFRGYTKDFGIYKKLGEKMEGEVLERLKNTFILYVADDIPGAAEAIAQELKENKNLVINFASSDNAGYDHITESLQKGKMLVDWLEEWRNMRG